MGIAARYFMPLTKADGGREGFRVGGASRMADNGTKC